MSLFTLRRRSIAMTAMYFFGVASVWCQNNSALSNDAQQLATKIQDEVAELRGLPFKRPIKADRQTPAEFGAYLDSRTGDAVPETVKQHYGKIIKKLGLYRGPEIQDFEGTMKSVMTSQAAAYYDPKTETFHVLMEDMPELALGAFYSHELHHGLQDQHFNLEAYMDDKQNGHALDSDHRLARQAVVEGEATYMMTLWTAKHLTKSIPPRAQLELMVRMQSEMDMTQLRAMMDSPAVSDALGSDVKQSISAAESIPPFILDTLMGVYLKGLSFVFAVQERGWEQVDRLYRDYPPESTEQILHPVKWQTHESPAMFEWQPFAKTPALKQWQLLDDDVLGEFQWRIIFREQGLTPTEANAASAGWNGDRYAVLKRDGSDSLLLLLRTSWDSLAEADEFIAAYRRVLAVKYADNKVPTRMLQQGKEVMIVEGGEAKDLDALMKFVRQSKTTGK